MEVTTGGDGTTFTSADGRIALGPSTPSFEVRGDRADGQGLVVEVEATALSDEEGEAEIRGRLRNQGSTAVAVERFTLLHTSGLRVGEDPRRWRIYRNGYQSWSGTWTIGVDERDRDLPTAFARTGATDARHPAPTDRGHVRSDALSAISDATSGDALAVGFTTLADAFAFVEVRASGGADPEVSAWVDLDGTVLAPGAATPWFTLRLAAVSGERTAGTTALRRVAEAAGDAMQARGTDRPHPGGWCSWYFYFTKVTEADVVDNLAVLAADGRDGPAFGCEYVMVDDGHQAAIGDWLTTNDKFSNDMAEVARRIATEGFDAGIWWAPFLASARSRVAADHPEWLVRDERGRPILGLLNPGWGLTTPMRVLDTTHPEVIDHLTQVAATIGQEWGYAIQKLDFLYAAALPGVRHDAGATRAQALRRGLEAIRAGAGDDSFLLGCGCPLGPAVGVVDAMRIGADVTPSWTSLLGRTVGRNRHGLATFHALLNTLTRSVLDGAWFLNDPDCLMVRDTDTKLTEDEVRLLCTVFGMTDGMLVLSDRLDRLSPARRAMVAQTRALAGGRPEVVDLFERALPELVVSRHPDGRVDVGLLNLDDRPRSGVVDLARLGLGDLGPALAAGDVAPALTEYWTGRAVEVRGTLVDVGPLPRHSARVLRLEA
ncbi:MAG: alpha-galactosidase [Acidimicrobiales bacterium]|nr:alpha-galactosidase [Acidimicrobiales bacterium]